MVATATFELPIRGRWLIDLDGEFVDDPQLHWRTPRFETFFVDRGGAVVDVLEVKPPNGGNEKVFVVFHVLQRRHAVIAGTMRGKDRDIDLLVVGDDRADGSPLELDVMVFCNRKRDGLVRQTGDSRGS